MLAKPGNATTEAGPCSRPSASPLPSRTARACGRESSPPKRLKSCHFLSMWALAHPTSGSCWGDHGASYRMRLTRSRAVLGETGYPDGQHDCRKTSVPPFAPRQARKSTKPNQTGDAVGLFIAGTCSSVTSSRHGHAWAAREMGRSARRRAHVLYMFVAGLIYMVSTTIK